jgi:hypothetical protein
MVAAGGLGNQPGCGAEAFEVLEFEPERFDIVGYEGWKKTVCPVLGKGDNGVLDPSGCEA